MSSIDKHTPKHDRAAVTEFLQHLAVELMVRQYGPDPEPLPPKLGRWAQRFRAKYGTVLLPEAGAVGDPAGEIPGGDDGERGVARPAAVVRRGEQARQVIGVLHVLREVDW